MTETRGSVNQDSVDESRRVSDNKPEDITFKARMLVAERLFPSVPLDEVYVVWFSKTLQNWKALVSTTTEDDLYYEVTYNGDKREAYIDTYRKINNLAVSD